MGQDGYSKDKLCLDAPTGRYVPNAILQSSYFSYLKLELYYSSQIYNIGAVLIGLQKSFKVKIIFW